MNWLNYKKSVLASREIIVFPFFQESLSSVQGIGIDIGCADGDLTAFLSENLGVEIIGVDHNSDDVERARKATKGKTHFVDGDVSKNAISGTGILFDFAFSNCCFTHLTDEESMHLFADLHSTLKVGGQFVFLVPSWLWAKDMYSKIEYVGNGITAVPRYGGKQFFRMPAWYKDALEECGYELENYNDILIPKDDNLDKRYQDKIGFPLFTFFIAKKKKLSENVPSSVSKAFDVALENRKFEIELFWRRSLFYWGFIATALIGYGTAKSLNSEHSVLFSLFGLVCSFIWAAGNRGSKYWQEYWERKVSFLQYKITGNIFFDRNPSKAKSVTQFTPRRISVSKLIIALSDFTVILWLVINGKELSTYFFPIPIAWNPWIYLTFSILTLVYIITIIRRCDSED